MPLPQFLLLIATVIMAGGVTLWVTLKAGVPLVALGLIALTGAAVLHLGSRDHRDHGG